MVKNTHIDWQNIDTVLLDMDGTLLDLHFDNYFWLNHLPAAYAERHQMEYVDAVDELVGRFEALRGTLQWYCLDFWNEELALDIVSLKREVSHLIRPRPEALNFLDWLKQQGKRRVLVTNAHRDSIAIKLEHSPLEGYLDRIISSHELGVPKEEDIFWEKLVELEPFDPARTLFIDDTASVLQAAERFGIAWVIGVHRPDSQGESYEGRHEYPLLEDFLHLMDKLNETG